VTSSHPQIIFADRLPIPESSPKIHKLTSLSSLQSLCAAHTHVIVDFYADWCAPCRAIAPVFSQLADAHAVDGALAFAKVNVDHVPDIAGRYGVRAMPTFLVLRRGAVHAVSVRRGEGTVQEVREVRGADVALLKGVVKALGETVRG